MNKEMKDSGVEWIGKIPSDWKINKYKHISNILNGFPFDSSLFDLSKGKPLIRIRDITSGNIETYYKGSYDDKFIIRKNDVIVGMDGDFNIRRWDNEDALLNQRCFKIYSTDKDIEEWIYYQVPFVLKVINDNTYSTTVKHLSHFSVLNSKIIMPPASTIKRINKFLNEKVDRIDIIIKKTKSTIEDYKLLKQSIITEAVTKGLNKNVAMKDSGIEWIGEVPKHWHVGKMKNYGKAIIGLTYSPSNVADTGKLVLRSSNVQNGRIDLSDSVFVDVNIKEHLLLRKNDILICARNGSKALVGKCALIPEELVGETFGAFMTVYRSMYNEFIYYVLNSSIFSFYIGIFSSSTINQLTTSTLNSIQLTIPPIDEQNSIVRFLKHRTSEIDRLIDSKTLLLTDLESYKKTLIYEYVTGKKEVN